MTFHDNEMTPQEIHGTLLRMATDELELGTEQLEMRLELYERDAQALLGSLLLRNEADGSSE